MSKPKLRRAWLVVVERTGECIDGCRTKQQAVISAGEFTTGVEPAIWIPVPYSWPPPSQRRKRSK